MADRLWDELQHLELGREDPELFIPYSAYADAIPQNRLSLIARPLNPATQSLHAVVASLPRSWGLASRVHGRVLDNTYIQFLFQSEIDLLSVQRREPWTFNNWFVAFQRWEDYPDINFLTTIDLWVQVRGIPLPYVTARTIRRIGNTLGEVVFLDFHEETTAQIAFIRVRIRFGITDRLRFFRRVHFQYGERAMICFQYERLRRICTNCLRLTHQASQCPYHQYPPTPRTSPVTPASPISNEGWINPEFHGVPAYAGRYDDELHRSSFNSQSQVSNDSFPTPLSQPPRLESPPLNPDELAEAFPYFPTTDIEGIPHFAVPISHSESEGSQHFAVPIPQIAQGRQQSSISSNIIPSSEDDNNSRLPRCFEYGESSRFTQQNVSRTQKHKFQDADLGGFQKPPKKR